MELPVGPARIRAVRGDITQVAVDAIVNAANTDLIGGGGVDGAVHRAGGPTLMMELNRIRPRGGCPTGSAVVTGAGSLPARWVIHAVGPVWRGGGMGEAGLLADAYATSLGLAAERGARSVSFPSISTGAYGYPVAKAAPVAAGAVARFLRERAGPIKEVLFVLFDAATLAVYDRALESLRLRREE